MRSAKEYKAIREEIYRFIGAYITKHVYAPSNKEIAEAVGISGTTVHRHLIDMIDEGILETDAEPGTQRAIRIRNRYTFGRDGQQVFEETHTREEFMKMFGRNYID